MDPAQREKLLLMILPAVGVIGVYMLFFARTKELTAATTGLAQAEASAVFPADVMVEQQRIQKLESDLAVAKGIKTDMDERWKSLTRLRYVKPAEDAAAIQRLNKLLWNEALFAIDETLLTSQDSQDQVPRAVKDTFQRLSETNAFSPVAAVQEPGMLETTRTTLNQTRLWRVKFYGEYMDVLDALRKISESDLPLMPVGIQMSFAQNSATARSWTLYVLPGMGNGPIGPSTLDSDVILANRVNSQP